MSFFILGKILRLTVKIAKLFYGVHLWKFYLKLYIFLGRVSWFWICSYEKEYCSLWCNWNIQNKYRNIYSEGMIEVCRFLSDCVCLVSDCVLECWSVWLCECVFVRVRLSLCVCLCVSLSEGPCVTVYVRRFSHEIGCHTETYLVHWSFFMIQKESAAIHTYRKVF